jgi:hypothetical protein
MDKIYIKLIPNQDKQEGDNKPSWVAPINPKSPAGKTWRIGASINGTWYNQCAFDDACQKMDRLLVASMLCLHQTTLLRKVVQAVVENQRLHNKNPL